MEFLSLSQLNTLIGEVLQDSFPETYWMMAETSDVRINNRHCYLEFIEKNPRTNAIVAKAKAYIWANTFELLKTYFEQKTGRAFSAGIQILVKVSIEFHPVYGYGLSVLDIDPSYTLGNMQLQRQAILRQLEEEGILNLNRELEMSLLPQRVAVISSATAAGYEDFLCHLLDNKFGFVFYPNLFQSVMQNNQAESSIIASLDKIYQYRDLFDVVVIIRGGGATSDLASFDSYQLAANCAQFPLPIITGIGHERDDTVLDLIAHHRAKTPTAVADFLIGKMEEAASDLVDCRIKIVEDTQHILETGSKNLQTLISRIPVMIENLIENKKTRLQIVQLKLQNTAQLMLTGKESKLKEKESFFKLSSPEYILAKGYSITLKNGKAVKSPDELEAGEIIEIVLYEGKIYSRLTENNK
ncbi:exodeoxyribonuclease 7 large subunit [Bacteroidia bacterium]|nr:exodeoxyribonuclease 7 large subunit [Bacteroidia bacterium]